VSDRASPETIALAELTRLVRHLGDELASYRKRALTAEARLKQLDEVAKSVGISPERSFEVEQENAQLKARLEAARERTTKLLAQVRFLRQQQQPVS
jgi:DNA repair ATPase RecN